MSWQRRLRELVLAGGALCTAACSDSSPGAATDASTDGARGDAAVEAAPDGSSDAAPDGSSEAASDGASDAASDASSDVASGDSASDGASGDGSSDASPTDASSDARTADAPFDAPTFCCNANPDPCCRSLNCGEPPTVTCLCKTAGSPAPYSQVGTDGGQVCVAPIDAGIGDAAADAHD